MINRSEDVLTRKDLECSNGLFFHSTRDYGAWEFPVDELDPWRKIYVRRQFLEFNAKNSWWLYWNGKRFAGSEDARSLAGIRYIEFPLFWCYGLTHSPFKWVSSSEVIVIPGREVKKDLEDKWWEDATDTFVKREPVNTHPETNKKVLKTILSFVEIEEEYGNRENPWVGGWEIENSILSEGFCNTPTLNKILDFFRKKKILEVSYYAGHTSSIKIIPKCRNQVEEIVGC